MEAEWKKSDRLLPGNIPALGSDAQPILPSLNITKEGKHSGDGPHTVGSARLPDLEAVTASGRTYNSVSIHPSPDKHCEQINTGDFNQ